MELKSSPKIYNNYKCDHPKNTINRIKKGLDEIGLNPIYNEKVVSTSNFSSYSGDLLIEELGFYTTGKGVTHDLAKASAYAEMAERISGGFFVFHTITDKILEYSNLLSDVIDRKFLKGFSKKKTYHFDIDFVNNFLLNPLSEKDFSILSRQGIFDISVDSYSFTEEKYVKVPIRFIELLSGSTGLASGNTFEEALVQGTCEIFERFAAYKVLSERIECPSIDVNSIDNDIIHKYVELFKSINVEIIVKDFSLGMGLPTVGVLFINHNLDNDKNQLKRDLYYKMIDVGSHPDLEQAIIRCFTERLQGLDKEEFMYRSRCDLLYKLWTEELGKKYVKKKDAFKDLFVDYEFCGDLSFLEKGKIISFDKMESHSNTDCLDDCKLLLDICKMNNWNLQVVDYTHPVLKFPTIRVILPPISTSIEPFIFESLKIEDFKKRFNFLYGIENLYTYITEDKWMNNIEEIKSLIKNLEEFLASNLMSFRICIRQGHFLYPINLLHILALCNLSIGNKDTALKYLNVLLELNDKPPFYSSYYNVLLNPGYNPSLFSYYVNFIKNSLEKNKTNKITINLEYNPFKPKNYLEDSQHMFRTILSNLARSFFVKK